MHRLDIRSFTIRASLAAWAAAASLAASPALAAYAFDEFDVPGAGNTFAFGINEHGDVVGSYDLPGMPSNVVAFSRIAGAYQTISVPGASRVSANDIDSAGNIVGNYLTPTATTGFLLPPGGPMQFTGPPGAVSWVPEGLNDLGQQSGFMVTGSGAALGFVWNGHDLTTIAAPGAGFTEVRNVNASGQMVGTYYDGQTSATWHSFLYENGSFSELIHPGGLGTDAFGINDAGDIVGDYGTASGNVVGFIRHANGSFEDILPPGAMSARVEDINNRGQLVGYFFDGSSGVGHGFVATPVPEPATSISLLVGLAFVGRALRRAGGRRAA